jgi:hypothetical protein
MPPKTETPIVKLIKGITFKDVVFVIGLLVSTGGWIRSEAIKSTDKDNKIVVLTIAVQEQTKQLEKINDILTEQQLLNGQIIQFMKMKQ